MDMEMRNEMEMEMGPLTCHVQVPGKSPEAAFLNAGGEEVERVILTGKTR